MDNQSKATPRPWHLMDDEQHKGKHPYHDGRFLVADNEENPSGVDIIAKFMDGNTADREFIVKAVNNHDDALEAIRKGIAYLESIKQGKKVDIQYIQGKMREVLFNASSNEYRSINWGV